MAGAAGLLIDGGEPSDAGAIAGVAAAPANCGVAAGEDVGVVAAGGRRFMTDCKGRTIGAAGAETEAGCDGATLD